MADLACPLADRPCFIKSTSRLPSTPFTSPAFGVPVQTSCCPSSPPGPLHPDPTWGRTLHPTNPWRPLHQTSIGLLRWNCQTRALSMPQSACKSVQHRLLGTFWVGPCCSLHIFRRQQAHASSCSLTIPKHCSELDLVLRCSGCLGLGATLKARPWPHVATRFDSRWIEDTLAHLLHLESCDLVTWSSKSRRVFSAQKVRPRVEIAKSKDTAANPQASFLGAHAGRQNRKF
jgi:hypothetical protein